MNINELVHHGILGQKWGVRRYQNADGSLTAAGKRRYELQDGESTVSKVDFTKGALTNNSNGGSDSKKSNLNTRNQITKERQELYDKLYKQRKLDKYSGEEYDRKHDKLEKDIAKELKNKYGSDYDKASTFDKNFDRGVKIVGSILLTYGAVKLTGLDKKVSNMNAQIFDEILRRM